MRSSVILAAIVLWSGCAGAPATGPADPREAQWDRATPEQRDWALRHPESAGFSPEEAEWVRENPEAARALGDLDPSQREEVRQRYEALPPEMQDRVRNNPGSLPGLAQ